MSALLNLLLAAASARAPEAAAARQSVRTLEQPLPATAKAFHVTHSMGNCTVQLAAPGQPPRARLELVASGGSDAKQEERWLDLCRLDVDPNGAPATVRSQFGPADQKPEAVSFAANLTLWLPAGADLELDQRFGAVTIDGPLGRVTVRSFMSGVGVSGAQGDVDVRGEFGPISVRDLKGAATLATKGAAITAERVGGHVDARTRGDLLRIDGAGSVRAENLIKPVELAHVRGDAVVDAPSSAVTARDIGGNLAIASGNQIVTVERVGGSLRVQHKNGKVEARAITGDATILGNLSTIHLSEVGGDVEVRSPNGAVRIARVGGKVIAENSAFALDLVDLRGDVEAHASGGLLRAQFAQLPADERAHTVALEAAGGQLELVLPAESSVELELISTSGQLDAELPGIITTQNGSTRIGVLKQGDGKVKLRAICVGGPVKARRAGT